MLSIAQGTANRINEDKDCQQEDCRQGAYSSKCRREHRIGLGLLIVGKAEQRGLHAKCQQYEDECCIGIDIGANAIVA